MTPTFVAQLCGFRDGYPSTSDRSQESSVAWGKALFAQLAVPESQPEVRDVGARLEQEMLADLGALRRDLVIARSKQGREFSQYAHLSVFDDFRTSYSSPAALLDGLDKMVREGPAYSERRKVLSKLRAAARASEKNHAAVTTLLDAMPEDSMLRADIAVSGKAAKPDRLLLAVSAKWSLRTDRAQDCVSQGNKFVSLRRGPMPLFCVVTMEPRPSMLKLLADGSGAIDYIFHLALPELLAAADALVAVKDAASGYWYQRQADLLRRMVGQGRLRSYADLRSEVAAL